MRYGASAYGATSQRPSTGAPSGARELVAVGDALEHVLLDDVPARRELVGVGRTPRRAWSGQRRDDGRRRGHQGMVAPPLGRITMPVTNLAAGAAR